MAPLTSKELFDYLLEGRTLTSDDLDQFLRSNPDEDQYNWLRVLLIGVTS